MKKGTRLFIERITKENEEKIKELETLCDYHVESIVSFKDENQGLKKKVTDLIDNQVGMVASIQDENQRLKVEKKELQTLFETAKPFNKFRETIMKLEKERDVLKKHVAEKAKYVNYLFKQIHDKEIGWLAQLESYQNAINNWEQMCDKKIGEIAELESQVEANHKSMDAHISLESTFREVDRGLRKQIKYLKEKIQKLEKTIIHFAK